MRPLIIIALILALAVPVFADGIKWPQFALSGSFVGLSAADTLLTIYGTAHLGLVEQNRLLRRCFERGNYAPVWTVQAVGVTAILAGCHYLIHSKDKTARTLGWVTLIAANIGRGYLVIHNWRLNRKVGH